MNRPRNFLLSLTSAAYLLSILEMFLMFSPFAAYFYGVYSPFLSFLSNSPLTYWLPEFFLPHNATPRWEIFRCVRPVGATTFGLGMGIFLLHFLYLYPVKFIHGTMADRFLYNTIRHPQYLGLILAGFGLALKWPRLLNLILFLAMVWVYRILASYEENKLEKRFGEAYTAYRNQTGRFLPKTLESLWPIPKSPAWRRSVAPIVLAGALTCGWLLRSLSIHSLHWTAIEGLAGKKILLVDPPQLLHLEPVVRVLLRASKAGLPKDTPLLYVFFQSRAVRRYLVDSGMVKDSADFPEDRKKAFYVMAISAPIHKPLGLGAERRLQGLFMVGVRGKALQLQRRDISRIRFYPHASINIL